MRQSIVFGDLKKAFSQIKVTGARGKGVAIDPAIRGIARLIEEKNKKGNKVILVGNGGSASIASHISTDLLKNGNIRAVCFNDSSLLTCISNDLGYEQVFKKPLEVIGEKGDVLIAISSSGRSANILNAVQAARDKGCYIVTLSGFSAENPLRETGEVNFYVPSDSYGVVEITHLAIAHAIADILTCKIRHG